MTLAYNPSTSTVTCEYIVANAGDASFIPGNNQAFSNSHDNPSNGTDAQREACCVILSPTATPVVAGS